ncbi:Putative integral outer membrane protein TolC, efflux pump component [Desulfamplus magnetovallimortis]|uniref:Putative integral outer membrane protein TolC, efflux pump component n=1 Tax=Desulfamplus magnetovallimortis TaxID=1246637 RepID=L0R509_9BACT|nr:TolC family protein [Desulfamplus magnetovallimortis]CCO06642.1 Putative integral outer membrane protein TolC,efflux pump component [Desulfamplus magnetovallimortis BW-1]SLM32693.1 Putative integral outer membrane protein TolC, efflux pump component [Desulfamplus magnetovallimortis]
MPKFIQNLFSKNRLKKYMPKTNRQSLTNIIFILLLCSPLISFSYRGLTFADTLDLKQVIEGAIQTSLQLRQYNYEINAARYNKKVQLTAFYPSLQVKYDYMRRDEPTLQSLNFRENDVFENNAVTNPLDEFQFIASFSQPVFSGFELENRYQISDIKVKIAQFSDDLIRQNIILDAINGYFSLLKFGKLVRVAHDSLEQIGVQREIAFNMQQAGLISITDLLQSEAELANARQNLVTAQNNIKNAQYYLNSLLQKPLTNNIDIVDITSFSPFPLNLDDCLFSAMAERVEIKIADQDIEVAEKEYEISKKDRYPSVDLLGTYTRRGTDPMVDGGVGIGDKNVWNIHVAASWKLWDWGRTSNLMGEKDNRILQARNVKQQLVDGITLEVRELYLKVTERMSAIEAAETAIEQSRENFRIIKEKYSKQMVTMGEFLTAQTLLTQSLTSYYNALYDFKISKAALYRAMGKKDLNEYVESLR